MAWHLGCFSVKRTWNPDLHCCEVCFLWSLCRRASNAPLIFGGTRESRRLWELYLFLLLCVFGVRTGLRPLNVMSHKFTREQGQTSTDVEKRRLWDLLSHLAGTKHMRFRLLLEWETYKVLLVSQQGAVFPLYKPNPNAVIKHTSGATFRKGVESKSSLIVIGNPMLFILEYGIPWPEHWLFFSTWRPHQFTVEMAH